MNIQSKDIHTNIFSNKWNGFQRQIGVKLQCQRIVK